jgi:tape measure domain-containing protein
VSRTIGDLAVKISADTGPLAQNLQQAVRELDRFGAAVSRQKRETADVAPMIPRGVIPSMIRTEALQRVRDTPPQHRRDMQRDFRNYGTTALGRNARWVGMPLLRAGGAVGGLAGGALSAGFDKVRDTAAAAGGSMLGFAKSAGPVGASLLAVELGLGGVAGGFEKLKQSVALAGELEQTKLAFEVMIGSAREANEVVADARRYAANSPFNNRDIIDASRQLIAYGRSADVVMRDVRMLGDVSAAFGKRLPIGDLAYLYGTLYAQQRAYTKDLYQFSNRGIPILRELGKVTGKTGGELQAMVEDGRIGFEDVRKAFEGMTGAGGAFFGMTQRQSQTFLGTWERMTDALEIAQTRFGGVLIEELGLGEAAREIEAFANKVEHNLDRIRPGVRTLGDLGRAAVQVGYEFGRVGVEVAVLNISSFADALPGLREAGRLWRGIVEDAKKFKIDDRAVVEFAFAFGHAVADSVVEWGRAVADFGSGLLTVAEVIVRSAREAEGSIKSAANWLNEINNKVTVGQRFLVSPIVGPVAQLVGLAGRAAAGDSGPPPGRGDNDPVPVARPWEIPPPAVGMSADRIRREHGVLAEYRRLQGDLLAYHRGELAAGRGNPVTVRLFETQVATADRSLDAYFGGFADPAEARRQMAVGSVAPLKGAAPPGVGPMVDGFFAEAKGVLAQMRGWSPEAVHGRLDEAKGRALGLIDARRAGEAREQLLGHLREGRGFGGGWHDLAVGAGRVYPPALDRGADRQAARAAALGAIAVERPPVPPDVEALRLDLRRQFDPMAELRPVRDQLDVIRSRGLLGNDTNAIVDAAWRKKVQEVAGRFGVGQRAELPSAVQVGSAEDARLINAWRTERSAMQPTERLLEQLLEVARQQLLVQQGGFDALAVPAIPPIRIPGPW